MRAKRISVIAAGFVYALLLLSKSAGASGGPPRVTFEKDIAPILQEHCQFCHRAGGIAPMSLVTYAETRPWARSIKEKVVTRLMPPFFAAGPIGYFDHDPRLTDEEIQKISQWVESKAPQGNPADHPADKDWPDLSLSLGTPDLLLKPRHPYNIQPGANDDYQLFSTDYVFPQDTWIRAIDIRPGNKTAVHHAALYLLPDGMEPGPNGIFEGVGLYVVGGQMVQTWVPGAGPRTLQPGRGLLIPKGSRLGLQVHYAPTEKKDLVDQTTVGIFYANGTIIKISHSLFGGTDNIEIPPNNARYQLVDYRKFKTDALIFGFAVHMHLRGKSFVFRLIYPDKKTQTVLDLTHYNFNWQRFYKLAKPLWVPKGTVVQYTAVWDNSAKNPYNPDPTRTIKFGEKTTDEMMSGTILYEIPDENLGIVVKNGVQVKDNKDTATSRKQR